MSEYVPRHYLLVRDPALPTAHDISPVTEGRTTCGQFIDVDWRYFTSNHIGDKPLCASCFPSAN